jgi:hypothetical protein
MELSKHFKFIFKSNEFIIWNEGRLFFFNLPSFYFYKWVEFKTLSFIFISYFHFISFLKHLFNYDKKLNYFYFFRIKLKGLGYRVTPLSNNLLRLFFNRSNFFYMHIPSCMLLKYKNRRLFFISTRLEDLKVSMHYLLLLKKQIVYRLKGLFSPKQIFLIKPGKNKFR